MRIKNRSPFKPRGKLSAYKIGNKAAENEATVYVYDEISWFGISAEQFIKDINGIDAKTIHIRFNSPGGNVFDGISIANAIRAHKSKTVSHIDGLAASIASVIALASDEVRMADNSFLMIHDPWSMVIGTAQTMREEADLLDKVGGSISKTYVAKTGKSEQEIADLMRKETWMTADEAKELGFVDAIDDEAQNENAKASLFDLSVFANVPERLKENRQPPTARDLERILRDAGCSKKQARVILAEGLTDDLWDEGSPQPVKPVEPRRDAENHKPKKDRVIDLLTRAEVAAPSLDLQHQEKT